MPTIKYIKDAVQGVAGDVAEVTDVEATALIALGLAVDANEIEEPKPNKKTTRQTKPKDE